MITRWKKTFLFCRRRDWLLFEDLFQKASADYHVCEWFIHDFIPAFGQWLQSQYGTLLTDIALRGKVSCGCSFNRGTRDSVLVCLPYFPPKKGRRDKPWPRKWRIEPQVERSEFEPGRRLILLSGKKFHSNHPSLPWGIDGYLQTLR